ncbi:juvenile hormone esterase-like isoform X1 [Neodiprion fabricii]|uniref:juvenile hormone esterase-like isoform X1 n=2 Tax=Neodiprion fabricii TaxID=2872261 RepID=UPI001ED91EE9|nr:juvenile hormone esterase-like isoform X1 [Neodiprion fabricii]
MVSSVQRSDVLLSAYRFVRGRTFVMAGPVVNVKQGLLRGAEVENEFGGSFISFKGVPYAAPPVGDLRFKEPQPLQPWTGIRHALAEGNQCPQRDECSRQIEGDDDCLYLNIATPSLEGSRPVMVWIHGGGFIWGDGGSNLYGPNRLVKMNVVVVSMNYRLGVFGFLHLDHEVAPGNLGMKDQVAGLKWVRENIGKFGGDPKNITIFGHSAGGSSVHYHLLSPLSKGLFEKAIAHSGVAFNPWASVSKTVELAHRLVKHFGKDTKDPHKIVEFLRTIPALELAKAQEDIRTPEEISLSIATFGVCVDDKSSEPFLPRSAREIPTDGCYDVPLMLGYVSHEGLDCTVGLTDEVYANGDQYFETRVSHRLCRLHLSKVPIAIKEIKKFYFKDKPFNAEVIEDYIRYTGDIEYLVGIHDLVENRSEAKSPTYLYRFFHNPPRKLSTTHFVEKDIEGVAHGDELPFIFYPAHFRHINFIEPGSTEELISKRFLRMWTDFARAGNPTPKLDDLINAKWEPVTTAAKNYMAIGAEIIPGVNPDQDSIQFWKRLRETYK